MSVVPYPIAIVPQAIEPEFRANTKASRSIFTKAVTTYERKGAHNAWRFSYRNLSAVNAARIENALKSLRGMANRCYVPVYGYTRRGSGFGSELFSNGTFANGTTGWTAFNGAVLTASDYVMRVASPSGGAQPGFQQAAALTQYAPHAHRSITHAGRGSSAAVLRTYIVSDAVPVAFSVGTGPGLAVASIVALAGTAGTHTPLLLEGASGYLAGDFAECSFASIARCALVDNAPNLLLQSDELDATWTAVRATVDDQALAGPDGSSTADTISEDGTAANSHYIEQVVTVSASAVDYSFGVFLKAGNRTWAALQLVEGSGSHTAAAYFNLSTGAVGSSSVSGANFSNIRTFAVSYGNGWYYCCVVVRKANAATSLTARIVIAEDDNDVTFSGLSQTSISAWRATLAQSSVPSRASATTAAATAGTSQTGGALHLKGLPASTSGILLPGDPVQILQPNGSQLVTAAAALNSDAAGLGYFQFNGQLFESPADSAAVIDVTPLARCLLDQDSVSFPKRPGVFTDVDFTLVEDIQRA